MAQWVLVLLPTHWWAELGPSVSDCSALGVSGSVPVHWCAGAGPGYSCGQGQLMGQLWAQGVLRLLVGGLCLHLASCSA